MEQPVTIFTIGNGVLGELFDRELERVVSDILDLNTKADAIRTISIKIAIKPDENRNFGMVGISVSSSLGQPKPVGTQIFFGKKNGKVIAVESIPQQGEMFDKLGPRSIVDFKTGEVTNE
ncbi:MAG: hypothetical protein JXA73_08950 [Acidobacteria bacterium]|nr:hypothetical protein [Acidobacteriota bacterium]